MKKALMLLLLVTTVAVHAEVKLPKIFSSNMVVQREKPLKIWGWAAKGESVSVTFNGKSAKAKANGSGQWSVSLPPMQHGGPYVMTINGKSNNITLSNILIGDVWVCSGQSNMEWVIRNTNNAEKEVAEGNHPSIRLFTVEKSLGFYPNQDLAGGQWQECSTSTLADFSAVAYFFGRKLNQELNVPIGLINTSWGGTNIQTWISWDMMSTTPEYKSITPAGYEKMTKEIDVSRKKYADAMEQDKGMKEKWFDPATAGEWKNIEAPNDWGQTAIGNADGIVWFRKEVEVPAAWANKKAIISLGPIDDWDETYLNGKLIGKQNTYDAKRIYTVEEGLKPGKNILIVKITDNQGGGGMYGLPSELFVEVGGQKLSLAGTWGYRISVLSSDFNVKILGPNEFPSQLYNAMVAPFIQFPIKGAIWYQGESNAWQAYRYRTLFPALINNWRKKWGYEFPFYWVQLANFMEPSAQPVESDWAELREAQNMTLSLPQTGQAVTTDIGEAKDIHPRNKQDVGLRLALAALHTTYQKDIVYAGPIYKSMEVKDGKIVLDFTSTGSGLQSKGDKYGYLRGFVIAGSDRKFYWAKAYIDNNRIVVYSDEVKNPVAVRYAWSNNPDDANLYNKEGLPASAFRTDDWKGITQDK